MLRILFGLCPQGKHSTIVSTVYRLRFLAIGVIILLLGAFVFPTGVSADTYSVSITATQYIPATLNVSVGDTIRFINTTTATQSAKTVEATGFNTGNIGPSENKSVVVSTAGTFSYTSQYTPSLTGTIVVAASTGALGGETSTSSASTSQPASTQEQPVSGVFEVMLAVIVAGVGFISLGMITQRFQPRMLGTSSTVDLPSISVRITNDEEDSPENHA